MTIAAVILIVTGIILLVIWGLGGLVNKGKWE